MDFGHELAGLYNGKGDRPVPLALLCNGHEATLAFNITGDLH